MLGGENVWDGRMAAVRMCLTNRDIDQITKNVKAMVISVSQYLRKELKYAKDEN